MLNSRSIATIFHVLVLVTVLFSGVPVAKAQDKECAIVLMHGKWGKPQDISFFGRRIEQECVFKAIEMPWSANRNYDVPYPVALTEIAEQVKRLRDQGYKYVLVGGHSFGANAALAYMADVGNADGVMALAPGHVPYFMYQKGIGKEAVDKARSLMAQGNGEQKISMDDSNQGTVRSVRMRADVLLSYFDPEGLGNMRKSVKHFKRSVPLLWAVGTQDPLYPKGADYAFNLAPPNPKSQYAVVDADHRDTPEKAVDIALTWIKGLKE